MRGKPACQRKVADCSKEPREASKTDGKTNAVATNYNSAGSGDVRMVNEIDTIDKDSNSKIPTKEKPNYVTKFIHNGKADQER